MAATRPDVSHFSEASPPRLLLVERKNQRSGIRGTTGASLGTESNLSGSLADPLDRRVVDASLKKLWRRVEIMTRTHRQAAAHYRARHLWWFRAPIGVTTFLTAFLSLATAVDVSGSLHPNLSLYTGLCAGTALVLILLQARSGWTGRAEVHRAAELELCQVALRLVALGQGADATGSRSSESRADSVRDLYRIDVYLQALQRCTPTVPQSIHALYSLLSSRLREVCIECPSVIHSLYDEESTVENPVPVEMQIDALDLLGKEVENYFLYPLFVPKARGMVSRTIDVFFARMGGEGRTEELLIGDEESQRESSTVGSFTQG